MILSSRPTDRRQLIEEAAGVTKYKARRRSAELKLDAARQNLLRVDDIVFEVEKQRGTLKRQAAKARRLPETARRAPALGEGAVRAEVSSAGGDDRVGARPPGRRPRTRVGRIGARRPRGERSRAPAHRDGRGRGARDRGPRGGACSRARDQPAAAADRLRSRTGHVRSTNAAPAIAAEVATIEARREPARVSLAGRRAGGARRRGRAGARRDPAGRGIGGLRGGAPRNRGARVRRRGGAQRGVLGHQLGDGASPCARARRHGARSGRRDAHEAGRRGRRRAHSSRRGPKPNGRRRPTACAARTSAIEATRIACLARESELASARIEHEWRARSVRARRADARRARGAADVARRARGRARRRTATRRAPFWRRPTARSISRARLPTISRSRPATNARSKRTSATCSSTSWSNSPEHAAAGFRRGARSGRGPLRIPDHGRRRRARRRQGVRPEP